MNFQKQNGESTPNILLNKGCEIMPKSNRPLIPANDYNEINSL